MKWGDSAPADAPTPPKAVSSLDSRMKLLCYFFFPLFFRVVGGISAFGECHGPSGSVTSKPVALNGISHQPVPTRLSRCGAAPLPPAPAALILYGQKLTLAQVSFDQREPYPVPETSASRGDGRN